MGIDIIFGRNFNIVSVETNEALDFKFEKKIVKKIVEVALQNKCQKVLCDFSKATLAVSRLDIYNILEYFERWGVPRNLIMAIVYSDDENLYSFWETVAKNNGFVVRVFADKDKAIEWLTNDN